MKSVKIHTAYCLAILCILLTNPALSHTGTDGADKKKKNKTETIKELSDDQSPILLDDIVLDHPAKIRVYNKHDVLVYEDEVASIKDIEEENLRKCFAKGEFVMKHNNISYYIINS